MKKTLLFIIILLCTISCEKNLENPTNQLLYPYSNSLCGVWLGYGYMCVDTYGHPELVPLEIILIEDLGNSFIRATKIIGDECVPTGEITWQGNYTQNPFDVELSYSFGTNNLVLTTPYGLFELNVVNNNYLILDDNIPESTQPPLEFIRATYEQINELNLNINIEEICKPQS